MTERGPERITMDTGPQHPIEPSIPNEIEPALVNLQRDFKPAIPRADDFTAVEIDWRGAFKHRQLQIGIERRVIDMRRLTSFAADRERLGGRRATRHQQDRNSKPRFHV